LARLEEFRQALEPYRRIALDTNAVIYFLDGTVPYFPLVDAVFAAVEEGTKELVLSVLVEMELLVKPYRDGDERALTQIGLLTDHYPNLSFAPITREVARRAAEIRAIEKLATPDALVAASVVEAGCDVLVGNDLECKRRLKSLSYLCLRDWIDPR